MEFGITDFVEKHREETLVFLKELAEIPAPTGMEEKRAAYLLAWMERQGIRGGFTDKAGNVLFPFYETKEQEQNLLVVMAHMDTVFTETEGVPVREEEGRWYCPGIGDDTANLVNMMMTLKYLWEHKKEIPSKMGILFAANVGEEGLGNLKGSKEIYRAYQKQIKKWVSLDLYYQGLHNRAVGSQRYEVTVHTKGGHSFGDFGNANAIAVLSEIITKLYAQQVPDFAKTTYNVGMIRGGTSVNSIAQEASMFYEFRSESNEGLKWMEQSFEKILQEQKEQIRKAEEITITVQVIGIRPGNGDVNEEEEKKLTDQVIAVIQNYYPGEIRISSASTDCNIPLSHGIPAVCFGAVNGAELHTKKEWIEKESMIMGQKIAIDVITTLCRTV